MKQALGQYRGLIGTMRIYMSGWRRLYAILTSPLFHFSLGLSIVNLFFESSFRWAELVNSSFPTILGFGLAAYTLIFALMGGTLQSALAQKMVAGENKSYLRFINITFFHAIFIQIITYIFYIVSRSSLITASVAGLGVCHGIDFVAVSRRLHDISNFSGELMTIYSVMLMISLLFGVFRLANIASEQAE